jgi:hypothetical protein
LALVQRLERGLEVGRVEVRVDVGRGADVGMSGEFCASFKLPLLIG